MWRTLPMVINVFGLQEQFIRRYVLYFINNFQICLLNISLYFTYLLFFYWYAHALQISFIWIKNSMPLWNSSFLSAFWLQYSMCEIMSLSHGKANCIILALHRLTSSIVLCAIQYLKVLSRKLFILYCKVLYYTARCK